MPAASSFAALVLVALVPGYLYLRLTESARRPRHHSEFSEFLEVLAVGLATTGTALGGVILICPAFVAEALRHTSLHEPAYLRRSVGLLALVGVLALLLAWAGAALTNRLRGDSYAPNVWHATLGQRRKGHLPYVIVELEDDRRVEGVLHAYTTIDGDHPRDIAVMNPKVTAGGEAWEPGADFVIINADRIRKIWMSLAPDPGAPTRRPSAAVAPASAAAERA